MKVSLVLLIVAFLASTVIFGKFICLRKSNFKSRQYQKKFTEKKIKSNPLFILDSTNACLSHDDKC